MWGTVVMSPQENRREGLYYWILTRDPDTGKPFLVAGGDSVQEARSKGLEILGGVDFEIRGLRTRNMQRASAIIRGKKLESSHSLRYASERMGHEKSIDRMTRRRRRNQQA